MTQVLRQRGYCFNGNLILTFGFAVEAVVYFHQTSQRHLFRYEQLFAATNHCLHETLYQTRHVQKAFYQILSVMYYVSRCVFLYNPECI